MIASLISLMPASPLRARAPRRTILMPLYSFGLWEAVMIAPPSRSWEATWKYIMSVPTTPMSVISAPSLRAPSMNPPAISGDESRTSRPTAIRLGAPPR